MRRIGYLGRIASVSALVLLSVVPARAQQPAEPTPPGAEPTPPGNEPTPPTPPGNEPTPPGNEPTPPGNEPTPPGGTTAPPAYAPGEVKLGSLPCRDILGVPPRPTLKA